MDLAAIVSQAATPRMTNADFPSNGRVPDSQTRAILADELKKFPNDPNLRLEVSKRYPDLLTQPSGLADTVSAAIAQKPGAAPKAEPGVLDVVTEAANAPTRALVAGGTAIAERAAHEVSGLGASIVGGWRGLTELARGGSLADAANAVHGDAKAGTYEPPAGSPGAKLIGVAESPVNPVTWPGRIATKAGEVTTDVTGSPAAGAAVTTGINAAPLLLLKGGKAGEPKPRVTETPRAITAESPNYDIPTVMRQRATVPLSEIANPPAQTAQRAPLSLVPAEPKKPGATPTIDKAEAEAPKFSESAPAAPEGKKLPQADQAARQALLARVGVNDVRKSAIEGDAKAAATDFQSSRLNNPAGTHMSNVLDQERQALTAHAEKIVQETGGTVGTDAHALEGRGHTILQPLEAFKQWFTDKTTGLYNEAKTRAQGQPVALSKFGDILGTDSKFANTDTIELRKGIGARMKELGMVDKDGKPLPATVEQAEQLRQYVNEEWSPKSNGRIRELKNALDEDVTSAAGEDIYKQARALHAMKESIFSDPKGLSSILDSEGINRKVPVEKIADAVTALPNAQFEHIVKTLKSVPPELKGAADGALAEIKAQLANRLIDQAKGRQGQWGARDVSAYLNKNAVKFERVFNPEEIAKIRDLNDAGHVLRLDQSYPGAAVQEHNLVRRGAMGAIRSGFAGIGALIGGPVGAAAGDMVGSAAASKFGEAAGLKAAQKRTTRLADFPK